MGQKVHPNGFRLGIVKPWNTIWYSKKSDFSCNIRDDYVIREYIKKHFAMAFISNICIERQANNTIVVNIYTSRPHMCKFKMGEKWQQDLALNPKVKKILHNVIQVRKPAIDAKLVADEIAKNLEKRVMFRRAMKRAIQSVMSAGAKGVKVQISGRLGGAEIARSESAREGRVPLHTLRADINYDTAQAKTTYGIIGIKVWIYKGEILDGIAVDKQPETGISKTPAAATSKKPQVKKTRGRG